jgi:hypothetical protein
MKKKLKSGKSWIRDPMLFLIPGYDAFWTPGSGMGKIRDPG